MKLEIDISEKEIEKFASEKVIPMIKDYAQSYWVEKEFINYEDC